MGCNDGILENSPLNQKKIVEYISFTVLYTYIISQVLFKSLPNKCYLLLYYHITMMLSSPELWERHLPPSWAKCRDSPSPEDLKTHVDKIERRKYIHILQT